MKMSLRLLALASLLTALLTTSGCIAAIGNDSPPAPRVSLGQQLIDLQKAKEAGAISETEYQTQRAKFLGQK